MGARSGGDTADRQGAGDPTKGGANRPRATAPRRRRSRLRAFWVRHRTLFWSLHSLWALFTGVAVMWLAQERYAFVPWVVVFLLLTWTSTLVFGRQIDTPSEDGSDSVPGAKAEAASYVTRTLYQETLFFLLPFYAYSTVIGTPNVLFLVALVLLALLSCLDLVFDRLLRTRPAFALVFFATVAFAALNLVLPMLWPIDPDVATSVAAVVAVLSAGPLSLNATASRPRRWLAAGAGAVLLAIALLVPSVVPPVPLRLESATFSRDLDRETLESIGPAEDGAAPLAGEPVLFAVLRIFAPSSVPASVSVEWYQAGDLVRTSRDVEITAHEGGFRLWDAWRPDPGPIPPGPIEVLVRTSNGRIFGRAELVVETVSSP